MSIIVIFLLHCFIATIQCNDTISPIKIVTTSNNARSEQVPLLIALHGTSSEMMPLAELIRHDLERAQTMRVTIQSTEQPTSISNVEQYFGKGYPFVLFLNMEESEKTVRSRLYNTLDVTMLQGKKWYDYTTLTSCAHSIADSIWKEIIGTSSCFLSSLAYITKEHKRNGSVHCHIIVTDWDGSAPRTVFSKNTHILAPTWLIDEATKGKALLFSEFTLTNARLMKVSLNTPSIAEIVLNRNGTTVGVSPRSLHDIVYCHSGALWHYRYDPDAHTSKHTCIIREIDPCACPIALRNGDVIYCHKGAIKRWNPHNNSKHNITKQGFCTSPAIHETSNTLLFSRRIQGCFQLIKKDLATDKEEQITYGPGNKIDASISPCGLWAVYTLEQNRNSSICLISLLNYETCKISNSTQYCMCPTWSPN